MAFLSGYGSLATAPVASIVCLKRSALQDRVGKGASRCASSRCGAAPCGPQQTCHATRRPSKLSWQSHASSQRPHNSSQANVRSRAAETCGQLSSNGNPWRTLEMYGSTCLSFSTDWPPRCSPTAFLKTCTVSAIRRGAVRAFIEYPRPDSSLRGEPSENGVCTLPKSHLCSSSLNGDNRYLLRHSSSLKPSIARNPALRSDTLDSYRTE